MRDGVGVRGGVHRADRQDFWRVEMGMGLFCIGSGCGKGRGVVVTLDGAWLLWRGGRVMGGGGGRVEFCRMGMEGMGGYRNIGYWEGFGVFSAGGEWW